MQAIFVFKLYSKWAKLMNLFFNYTGYKRCFNPSYWFDES